MTAYSGFRRDMVWNVAALACVAIGGVLVNLSIARFYGPDVLGVFNQALALFIFASQIAVFGTHFSVLHRLSVWMEHRAEGEGGFILGSALAATVLTGSAALVAGFALTPVIGMLFSSPSVATAWLWLLPGLPLLAFNKVLLNAVNALHHMRAFAFFSGARYGLAVLFLAIAIAIGWPGEAVTMCLTMAEAVLFAGSSLYIVRRLKPRLGPDSFRSIRDHLAFGGSGLFSGAVSELNTKTDILILGLFASDRIVGVYSLASMVFEGLWMLASVLRNLANPLIARQIASAQGLMDLQHRFGKPACLLTLAAGAAALALYQPFTRLVMSDPVYEEALIPLAILTLGIVASAWWVPMDMLFVQAGRPGLQSFFKTGVFIVNFLFNLTLVPFFGMTGSAIGTALAQVANVIGLKILARRVLNVKV